MNVSRRSFLGLGMGGTAALFLAPILRPQSLFASPVILPANYLESGVHARWMRLSYNDRLESRDTRRTLGAVLRNLGPARGQGRGQAFAPMFDRAVTEAFERHLATGQKPRTSLSLVQGLYDDFIRPKHGPAAGEILFRNLLAILRGRDGTPAGGILHKQYQLYQESALAHKNLYRFTKDPAERLLAQQRRAADRAAWTEGLLARAHLFAIGKERLLPDQVLDPEILAGWKTETVVLRLVATRLRIRKAEDQIIVSWNGRARLERAPSPQGPWTPVNNVSPAAFDADGPRQFFRTVDRKAVAK